MKNLTGKQKCQLLINLSGDKSEKILGMLSEKSAQILSETLEDAPDLTSQEMRVFLDEVVEKLTETQKNMVEKKDEETSSDELSQDLIDTSVEEVPLDNSNENDFKNDSPYPENYQSMDVVVERLLQHDPQLIAFFLAHVEERFRDDIKEELSEDLLSKVDECDVNNVPVSNKIFDCMFDEIVLKPSEDVSDSEASHFN